jgi:hypothetical protein
MLETAEDFEWFWEGNVRKIRFDGLLVYQGKNVFFEVERGTQKVKDIEEKVREYIKIPESPNVIITVQDYRDTSRFKSAQDQAYKILEMLSQYRRGNQFLVAPHTTFLNNPLGELLFSPTGEVLSLKTL